ncbi:MAG: hypothetical protein ACOZBW_10495 [Thermodesulfobacteriota bacterium]
MALDLGAVLLGIRVSDFAVIGMGTILSVLSRVGEWAIVAEGAVVKAKQEVAAAKVAAGNPAAVIRDVQERDRQFWTMGKQVYVDLAARYRKSGMIPIDE